MLKKIKQKYDNFPQTVRASFWFLVCGFIQRGISLLTTPIFSRLLSTSEYGDFNVYNSWHNIIIIFASLNLASGVYMRGLVKYEDDRDKFSGSLQILYLVTTSITLAIYLIFHNWWNSLFGLTSPFVYTIFIDIIVQTAYHFWSAEQRVEFQYRKLVFFTLLNAFLRPTIGIICVLLFPNNRLEARIYSMVAVDVLTFAIFFLRIFRNGVKTLTAKYWKYALAFNLPLVPHYLSQIVLNQSDRIMIKKMVGSSESGIYSLAYSAAAILTIVNTALINTLTPWMYKKMKAEEYKEIGVKSIPILIFIAFINFALVSFAPEAIAILAPASYYDAIWIIPPVTTSTFFIFMYSLFANFEFYFDKTKYMMIASVLGAATNLGLNYIFINIFGYYAAGYTTLVCYLLYCIGHYLLMRRINNKMMGGIKVYNLKLIILISLSFVGMCAVMMLFYNSFIPRIIIFSVICGFAIWKRNLFLDRIREMRKVKKEVKNKKEEN